MRRALLRARPRAADAQSVLRQLDAAAANFHSTSADFEFDTIETDPVYDKDVQKGTVYYDRKGTSFKMAVHISEAQRQALPKVYTYTDGIFKLLRAWPEPGHHGEQGQASTRSYLMLGFGASGKELAEKWDIKYLGPETIGGVNTEKLELVAKDPEVRKNLTKVTIWIDPDRAVSLSRFFDFRHRAPRASASTPTSRSISLCRRMPSPSRPTSRRSTAPNSRNPGRFRCSIDFGSGSKDARSSSSPRYIPTPPSANSMGKHSSV